MRVAAGGHRRDDPVRCLADHPAECRADDVRADQHEQARLEAVPVVRCDGPAGCLPPLHRQVQPLLLGQVLCAGCLPPLLPAVTGEAGQPAQDPRGSVAPVARAVGRPERRRVDPGDDLPGAEQAGRPGGFIRARREGAPQVSMRASDGLRGPGRAFVGPHLHGCLPNSTSSDRGSYPGAGGAGSFPARAWRAWCARSGHRLVHRGVHVDLRGRQVRMPQDPLDVGYL